MAYVDGFVIVVPKKNLAAYRKMARAAGKVWRELGALDYVETVGDDLTVKMGRSFPKLAKAGPRDAIVFSWIVYASKGARDRINAKVMKDPRIEKMIRHPSPFNPKNMSYGGFKVLVQGMKYLVLIHLDEQMLSAMPEKDMSVLNARHLELNESLLTSGHFIGAEALEPAATTAVVRVRDGKVGVVDGPFAETKEQVAGFYFIEARDLNEAIQVATRIPSAPLGTVEVRPCRNLIVDGTPRKASSKST